MGTSEYARPELLAEPDWVWEHRSETSLRVVDCGPEAAYWRAHVPGAVVLPIDPWLKDSADGRYVIGPDAVAEVMSTLGVDGGVTVVIYDDDENAMLATRLWWVLAYYGHEKARVLNGGWRRWIAEGRPIASREEPPPKRAQFVARPNEELIARLGDVRSGVESGEAQVLDVRPHSYWEGSANPFGNLRVGHIPGAANVDSGAFLLDQPPYTFKRAGEMEALVQDAGMAPKRATIVTARRASGRQRVCLRSPYSAGRTCAHTTQRWPSGRTATTRLSSWRRALPQRISTCGSPTGAARTELAFFQRMARQPV